MEAKALRYQDQLNVVGARRIRTFEEFDGRYTAPMHGFRDAEDYWSQSSSRQYLPAIVTPTLLLNARNDPFLTAECFPYAEAEASPCLQLEAPASGGHVGFLDLAEGIRPWSERRIVQFLDGILGLRSKI
jgi:predicted alpha/beta-fold hydrolase